MKRSVLHDYNQLEEKLTGYVAMLNFKFLNLCVKAEEASLLPVTVNVDGASKKLEEVAGQRGWCEQEVGGGGCDS